MTQELTPNPKPLPTPKSTYETPEERAKRQLWQARQTALTLAVNLVIAGKNSLLPIDQVAEDFEKWITRE